MTDPPWPADPVADLLEVLDLNLLGEATISVGGAPGDAESDLGEHNPLVFVGRSQYFGGRVFGGQVLAQSLIAAGRTVADVPGPSRMVHSLHGYFVRGGDDSHPIRFVVERLRDGGSFSVRRVHAVQRGETLLSMTASFQVPADGLTHQGMMPAAPDPTWLPAIADQMAEIDHPSRDYLSRPRAIDIRHVEGNIYLQPGRQRAARQSVWIRCTGALPDDPLIHAAVLTYASDFNLLEPVLRRHGLAWVDRRLRPASLDHAMWFHRHTRADDWVLYAQSSPSATGGRGLAIGRMFAQDGRLVASVAQEGMLRLKPD
ncbi:MAG: acyl-CoA thioesterase II [Dermatophilaceae bacterium]